MTTNGWGIHEVDSRRHHCSREPFGAECPPLVDELPPSSGAPTHPLPLRPYRIFREHPLASIQGSSPPTAVCSAQVATPPPSHFQQPINNGARCHPAVSPRVRFPNMEVSSVRVATPPPPIVTAPSNMSTSTRPPTAMPLDTYEMDVALMFDSLQEALCVAGLNSSCFSEDCSRPVQDGAHCSAGTIWSVTTRNLLAHLFVIILLLCFAYCISTCAMFAETCWTIVLAVLTVIVAVAMAKHHPTIGTTVDLGDRVLRYSTWPVLFPCWKLKSVKVPFSEIHHTCAKTEIHRGSKGGSDTLHVVVAYTSAGALRLAWRREGCAATHEPNEAAIERAAAFAYVLGCPCEGPRL